MQGQRILLEQDLIRKKRQGDLTFVIFNRVEKRNALNSKMLRMLQGIMSDLENEKALMISMAFK